MRRSVLAVVLVGAAGLAAAVGFLVLDDGEGGAPTGSATAPGTDDGSARGGERSPGAGDPGGDGHDGDDGEDDGTGGTGGTGPIESTGAAPASGALLSEPARGEAVEVGEDGDCGAVDPELAPVECTRVEGSGGRFLVFVGRDGSGALEAQLLMRSDGTGGDTAGAFEPVARTERFEADVEVRAISLVRQAVGGEPVVVVDYDFGGSGSVHSFDVVAWDAGADAPSVVAFVGGTGRDRFRREGETVQFVSANYDDGAPTCCPNQAEIRTLAREGPGEWRLDSEVVPISEAP